MKVRVLKEMPFAKVGEVFETSRHNCFDFNDVVVLHINDVLKWIEDGWLEEVKEESLEDKLDPYFVIQKTQDIEHLYY